jgi:hypothetical protein
MKTSIRILVSIALLFLGIIFPWWVVSIAALLLLMSIEDFWEVVVVFFVLDLVFMAENAVVPGIYFLGALLAFLIISLVKKFIR